MKPKLICFHPAVAPYRVDTFNLLAKYFDFRLVLLGENLYEQIFDQKKLVNSLKYPISYLVRGFVLKGRYFRFGVMRCIKEFSPNVILTYESSPITLFLCVLKIFVKRRLLWTTMDDNAQDIKARRGVRAWVRNWVLRRCDGCIATSEEAIRAFRECVPNLKCKFVSIPIIHDLEIIREREEYVIQEGKIWRKTLPSEWKKVLLYVGRLTNVKNLTWLVDEFKKYLEMNGDDIGLVFVGAGEDEILLRDLVTKMKLENNVLFLGRKEHDALYAVMSAADALVLPSIFELYGAVVGEALQWGTPVLVSENVGAKVLVNEKNGYIFDQFKEGGFARGLAKVLEVKFGNQSLLDISLDDSVRQFCRAVNMMEDKR